MRKVFSSIPQRRGKGKFWPPVRALNWIKAQDLFQANEARTMGEDFKGPTAEHSELREAGYFYAAKLIVLRDLWLQKKGLPTSEEEKASHGSF